MTQNGAKSCEADLWYELEIGKIAVHIWGIKLLFNLSFKYETPTKHDRNEKCPSNDDLKYPINTLFETDKINIKIACFSSWN